MSNPLVPESIRERLHARSGVAAFDADGTLWHGDVAEDFALWMIGEGHFDGSLWPVYLRCNAEDPAAGALQILRFYEGLDVRRLRLCVERFWQVAPSRRWLMRVRATMQWTRSLGLENVVVSASPSAVLSPLRRHVPVDRVLGMELEVDRKGRATGRSAGVDTVGGGKAERLREVVRQPIWLAVGNSVLDIALLRASRGVAWAINPDPALRAAARAGGWLITDEPEE